MDRKAPVSLVVQERVQASELRPAVVVPVLLLSSILDLLAAVELAVRAEASAAALGESLLEASWPAVSLCPMYWVLLDQSYVAVQP